MVPSNGVEQVLDVKGVEFSDGSPKFVDDCVIFVDGCYFTVNDIVDERTLLVERVDWSGNLTPGTILRDGSAVTFCGKRGMQFDIAEPQRQYQLYYVRAALNNNGGLINGQGGGSATVGGRTVYFGTVLWTTNDDTGDGGYPYPFSGGANAVQVGSGRWEYALTGYAWKAARFVARLLLLDLSLVTTTTWLATPSLTLPPGTSTLSSCSLLANNGTGNDASGTDYLMRGVVQSNGAYGLYLQVIAESLAGSVFGMGAASNFDADALNPHETYQTLSLVSL
jgi:hypothetical protein